MKKVTFPLLVVLYVLSSCSMESKIISKLKEEGAKTCSQYKFIHCEIEDSISYFDLKDSIDIWKSSLNAKDKFITEHKSSIIKLEENREECVRHRRNTLYYLVSTYDRLIRDYDDLISKEKEQIEILENDKNLLNREIEKTDSVLSCNVNEEPIFFVVRHNYDCGGGIINEKLYINKELQIYKTEYYEEF